MPEMTEKYLIENGWSKVGSRWLKNGAIICSRKRGNNQEVGLPFADAVKIEKIIQDAFK